MWFLEIKFYWSIFAKSAPLKINPNHFNRAIIHIICWHGNSLSKWFHKNPNDSLRIWSYYFHNLTKFISGCRKIGYDIIFNIDGSASIGEDDFEKIKRWGLIWPWLTSNDPRSPSFDRNTVIYKVDDFIPLYMMAEKGSRNTRL